MVKIIAVAAALTLAGCATFGNPEHAERMCKAYDDRAALALQDVQRIRESLDVLDIDEAERALRALELDRATEVLLTMEQLADIWCVPAAPEAPVVDGGTI